MDKLLLQSLSRCYQSSKSLVLIMNTQWEILWSNRPPEGIVNLPAQLGIAHTHNENTTHQFVLGHTLQECRLLCNLQDDYRVAEIYPSDSAGRTYLRMDVDAITASVQSMTSACHALHAELDELELYDQTPLLNVLIGNCYRIYRMAYLQKELDRLQSGRRSSERFSVNTAMRTLYQKCNSILRSCVRIETEICDKDLFLTGDMDEFSLAVLSAITLCCRGSRNYQTLTITLEERDSMGYIQLCAFEEPAELTDRTNRIEDVSTGNCEGEHEILHSFCRQHEGRWLFSEQSSERTKTCTIYFTPDNSASKSLTLHSNREVQETRFYNMYEVLLSCIHYRKMF